MLVERFLFPDEKIARSWIMSGKVIVNGQRVTKPGTPVHSDTEILIRGLDQKYASRGGLKVEAAFEGFGVSVANKVVLNAGAAAGGLQIVPSSMVPLLSMR
jgi:23S rRNA (cytidine1920-2'-O)/16S rRNA (cytidine1409-2'-O)-methyltransferase